MENHWFNSIQPERRIGELATKKATLQNRIANVDSITQSTDGDSTKIVVCTCPNTLQIRYTSSNGAVIHVENTPANVNQVDQLIKRICEDGNLSPSKNQVLNKLVKGAKYVLANSTLLKITNQELFQANSRRNQRAN